MVGTTPISWPAARVDLDAPSSNARSPTTSGRSDFSGDMLIHLRVPSTGLNNVRSFTCGSIVGVRSILCYGSHGVYAGHQLPLGRCEVGGGTREHGHLTQVGCKLAELLGEHGGGGWRERRWERAGR